MKHNKKKHYYIVTITGGLGSQMAKYAFYVLLNKKSVSTINMIDTYFYQYQESWNGYELNRIFGIDAPNLVSMYDKNDLIEHDYFKKAFKFFLQEQPDQEIIHVSRGEYTYFNSKLAQIKKVRDKILFKLRYEIMIHLDKETKKYGYYRDIYKKNIYSLKANVYYDEFNYTSDKYFKEIRNDLLKIYKFPDFIDENNIKCKNNMLSTESVVMHIRRSDHLYDNDFLFQDDYYLKAVNYLKEKVKDPIFYIFSDEPEWCESNRKKLGLQENDEVVMVNWNKGEESFRDMQLMTYAKHNILAISSFSWWGYYLSVRKNKIVCAPQGYWLEVEKHF